MSILTRRGFLGALAGLSTGLMSWRASAQNGGFPKSSLVIVTSKGRHPFNIEMALTNRQQAQGLMFRRSMAADAGMMFDYRAPQIITMWMRNTFIPLDMIFVGADGRIINIAERTVPQSEAIVPSARPARAVIEVNGGTANRLGIKPGDTVEHAIFGNLKK